MFAGIMSFVLTNIMRYWKQLAGLLVVLGTWLRLEYLKQQNRKLKASVKQHETKDRILDKHKSLESQGSQAKEQVSNAKTAEDLNKVWKGEK